MVLNAKTELFKTEKYGTKNRKAIRLMTLLL